MCVQFGWLVGCYPVSLSVLELICSEFFICHDFQHILPSMPIVKDLGQLRLLCRSCGNEHHHKKRTWDTYCILFIKDTSNFRVYFLSFPAPPYFTRLFHSHRKNGCGLDSHLSPFNHSLERRLPLSGSLVFITCLFLRTPFCTTKKVKWKRDALLIVPTCCWDAFVVKFAKRMDHSARPTSWGNSLHHVFVEPHYNSQFSTPSWPASTWTLIMFRHKDSNSRQVPTRSFLLSVGKFSEWKSEWVSEWVDCMRRMLLPITYLLFVT